MAGFPAILEARLQEEDFDAKLLSRTRVPIIKMKQRPTPECPQELQCDIGFKNHLAIHNTQLLLCYSKCDVRVKQMVLFVKVRFTGWKFEAWGTDSCAVVGQEATH